MSVARARILRLAMTEAEDRLWPRLRDRALAGWKFRRQVPVAGYVADFACWDAQLVVELDGGQHTTEADAARTAAITAAGWRVLRFWNNDVLANTDGVLETILAALAVPPEGLPRPRGKARTGGRKRAPKNPLPAGEGRRR
jgi:very-short-patch-repair endonuclease